jgi:hypothetical protein
VHLGLLNWRCWEYQLSINQHGYPLYRYAIHLSVIWDKSSARNGLLTRAHLDDSWHGGAYEPPDAEARPAATKILRGPLFSGTEWMVLPQRWEREPVVSLLHF